MCDDDAAPVRAAIMSEMQEAYDEGHSFLPATEIYERVGGNKKQVRRALYDLLEEGKLQRDQGAEIYLPDVLKAEVDVAKHVKRLLATGDMAIIVGPPGTGKTTRIRELVRNWHGPIYLSAVTGRAAARLSEVTGAPAQTVAKLLRFNGNTYQYGERNRLPPGLVIVDEASMLDVLTAAALFRSVDAGSTVLLIGDTDQLESVGPGQVLKDLLAWGRIPTTRLRSVFRQTHDSRTAQIAKLLRGARPLSLESSGDWAFVHASGWQDIVSATVREVARQTAAGRDVQVLAPVRTIVHVLNLRLQALLNPARPGLPEIAVDGERVRVGDRIVLNRNDYRLDTRNGELAKVASIDERTVTVLVDQRLVQYEVTTLGPDETTGRTAFSLGYALTIHRAQGSEFDNVVVAFPYTRIATRNLLYTGITRSRGTCTLVSQWPIVAAAQSTLHRRYSKLLTRLRQP